MTRAGSPCAATARPRTSPAAAVYLASRASAWTTGELLKIDGMVLQEIVPKDVPDL